MGFSPPVNIYIHIFVKLDHFPQVLMSQILKSLKPPTFYHPLPIFLTFYPEMLPDWFLGMSVVLSFPSSEFTGRNGKHSGPMWLDSLVGLIHLLLVPFVWKGWTLSIYPTWINPNSMIQRIRTLHNLPKKVLQFGCGPLPITITTKILIILCGIPT